MLRVVLHRGKYKMRWSEEDLVAMAEILGGEYAEREVAPLNPSVLRLAERKHVRLGGFAARELGKAVDERLRAKALKLLVDAPQVPIGLKRVFPHQRADLHYIKTTQLPSYLLAHQVGVGKTLIAMLAARRLWLGERILVICPNKAKRQWRREIRRWIGDDERVTIVEGKKGRRNGVKLLKVPQQIKQAQTETGWVIGHWESLVHADEGYLARDWDVIILDEAHRISNRKAQRSETVFELKSKHRLALTAHPFSNQTDELFSILRFLYPERYTSFWRFFAQHVKVRPKAFGGLKVLGARFPKLLRWEIAPFTLRRTKREVFKTLPTITRSIIDCELSPRGQREYAKLRKEVFVELDGLNHQTKILPIINDLSRVTRLRQYLVDPGLVGGREPSAKYPMVMEWLDDLDGPPVLFTSFRQAAERLIAFLRTRRRKLVVGLIAGGMTSRESDAVQRRFLGGKLDLLVAVTAAASESLNLGKYGYVGHLDLPWNPRMFEQTEGRVDRPEEGTGKLVPTTSWRFIVPDSYEEKLEAKLEKKHKEFGEVFTVGELRRLFT